jgi:hypothetical protein
MKIDLIIEQRTTPPMKVLTMNTTMRVPWMEASALSTTFSSTRSSIKSAAGRTAGRNQDLLRKI